MNEADVIEYITRAFEGVETETADGYTFFFYGADHMMPFATLGSKDNDFDRVSNLDRPGVFRLNIGVSKETYHSLCGPHPAPPGPSGMIETGHNFTALDQIMPHPTYAPQSWICVVSPSDELFERVKPLLTEAYNISVDRGAKRKDV